MMTRWLWLLVSLLATLASAQPLLIEWRSTTGQIPSLSAGDPAFLGLGNVVIGTDTLNVGAYDMELFDGGLLPFELAGGTTSADVRGSVVALGTNAGGVRILDRLSGARHELPISPVDRVALGVEGPGLRLYASNATRLRRFDVVSDGGAGFTATELAELTLPAPATGLAVDDRTASVFVATARGLYLFDGINAFTELTTVDAGTLGSVVSGLEVSPFGTDTLVFSAAVADAVVAVHRFDGLSLSSIGRFEVGAPDGGALRLNQPRHVAIESKGFPGFPGGLLIVSDGVTAQYRLVPLDAVIGAFGLVPPAMDGGADGGLDGGSGDGGIGPPPRTDGGFVGGGGGGCKDCEPLPLCGCSSGPLSALGLVALVWFRRRSSNAQ